MSRNMGRGRKRPFSGVQDGPGRNTPQRPAVSIPQSAPAFQPAVKMPVAGAEISNGPRFADLRNRNLLHQTLIDTITEDLKFDTMMPVQAATLEYLLKKNDCLAQARTGTGKTLAFLLPAIQTILTTPSSPPTRTSLLVLCPTRELALQIAVEAKAILKRFPSIKVATSIGGTNKNTEGRAIANGSHIIVATPGRFLDHLSDEHTQFQMGALQTLVLDEADRMLDMGFLPDIRKIISYLPKKEVRPRQSMLFSATVGDQVKNVAHFILNPSYEFISTIPKGEINTHERVDQFLVMVPGISDLAPALLAAIKAESKAAQPFKAIVFATTAAVADFYGHVLSSVPGLPTSAVLHSRLSQGKRTSITQEFRKTENGICIATDVIARGMDFPGVTHVFQVGLPLDKDSYIHRLGRTARADAEGRGILILAEAERAFLYQLREIKLQQYPTPLGYGMADIESALRQLDTKGKIYQASLGYYKSYLKLLKWSTSDLIQNINDFALQGLHCPEIPGLQKKTIGKMGLKGVPGLVALPNEPGSGNPSARGGGEGRRNGPIRNSGR